jgi:HNH endonuclease/NUMOD4 motif
MPVVGERWLSVPGFPKYDVSNTGRVRSWQPMGGYGFIPDTPRLYRCKLNMDGYPSVALYRDGVKKDFTVASLVLMAFVGPRPDPPFNQVCHRNDIPTDNRVENLYWGSVKQNAEDRIRNGRQPNGGRINTAKLTEEDVRYVRRSSKSHAQLARELGTTGGAIWHIRAGRTWKHVK